MAKPGRPRRSTRDEFLDRFSDLDAETQEYLIEVCGVLHRQKLRRGEKKEPAKAGAPAQEVLPGAAAE